MCEGLLKKWPTNLNFQHVIISLWTWSANNNFMQSLHSEKEDSLEGVHKKGRLDLFCFTQKDLSLMTWPYFFPITLYVRSTVHNAHCNLQTLSWTVIILKSNTPWLIVQQDLLKNEIFYLPSTYLSRRLFVWVDTY